MAHDASSTAALFEDDITVDDLRLERAPSGADDLARAIGAGTGLALDPVLADVLGRPPSWSWWLTRTRK